MTPHVAPSVAAPATEADPRLAAFCAPAGLEVFSAIIHTNQVWTPDPFDVDTIHADAREAFDRLVRRATATPGPAAGKSLLLLGEAGSGKTHLMRAFRNKVHADGTGYCGYLQMTTRSDNYARYVLSNLIDSLSQPYREPSPTTGLARLASGLLDALDKAPAEDRRRLREEDLTPAELAPLVHSLADAALQVPRFQKVDLDVIRAVLYLLSDDVRVRPRIIKWLRCEDLSRYDREVIGDLVPRPQDHMPLRTIVDLARLMAVVHEAALVLSVDQLEEMLDQGQAADKGEIFRRVIDAIITITDVVPTAVVIVACLEDYFKDAGQSLTRAKLDRLVCDPEPIRLSSTRSADEIEAMIGRRLEVLYDAFDLTIDPERPTFPFRREHLSQFAGLRTRDVLDQCRRYQERCIQAGHPVDPEGVKPPPPPPPPPNELTQLWNDFRAAYTTPIMDDEASLAELLAWGIQAASAEVPEGAHIGAESDGRFIPVEVHGTGNAVSKLLVAICDKGAQRGGLGRQVEEVAKRAGELPAVLVRSSPYPTSPKAEVSKQIAALIAPKGKGRRVEVQSADWRALAAFREFHAQHHADPAFAAWQREERPLAALPALRAILDLDRLPTPPAVRPTTPAAPPAPPAPPAAVAPKPVAPPAPPPAAAGALALGTTRGAAPGPVTVTPAELIQHAAFLGGSGSGKTTAALRLIEQLLLQGVPAVLVDRKGDLARYADPAAWDEADDPARAAERRQLRDRIDVALYTPGNAAGRPLTLPLAPADLGELSAADREQLCGYTAAALGGMMGYKPRGPDPKLAILGKAIEVLAAAGRDVTVRGLHQIVEDQDEALLMAVGGFEARHYKKLADDLLALALQHKHLLDGAGEMLDVDALLGRGAHATGRARLAVINTQFLGAAVDFWLAQFLVAVDRWRSRNPAPAGQLQAVFLFDEADQYLPATRQPATKGPLERLLRQARSAGLGLFLASQSPGDFDYRCRDQIRLWLVGRVREKTALAKLKATLEAGRVDAEAKLPGQGTGQFYLARERDVLAVQTDRSLIATAQLPEHRILELARATAAGR